MRKYLSLAVVILVCYTATAQQQAVFTNYLLNDYYFNPAIAGSRNQTASLGYRNQWAGFEGAPKTLLGNFQGSLNNKGKHGYGLTIISDKTGLTQRTGVYINYAHHFKLSSKLKLGFGVQPGYVQYRVTLYDVIMADKGDDILTGNVLSANAIDINAGFNLYSEKFFFMGSFNQAIGKEIQFTSYNEALKLHYTAILGYNYKLKKKDVVIQPSIMGKFIKPLDPQLDVMVKTTFKKKFWFGLTYRTADAASISLGYNFKERLNIGYAYDYSISGISQYQSGSHEIGITFVINKKKATLDEKDEELNNSIMDEMKKNNKK